ncbi:MAG: hypothetical protein IBX44_07420 [Sulfurospirillum sp.]|nr:hypothetical protein [Sulfurospirillum sp.]
MGTLSKTERQALDELFISMNERKSFINKLKSSRKEMRKIFKILFSFSKKTQHPISHF